ncbi:MULTISPECIES: hypothetical protein [unclassified Xanthomonas]|uniref:hypothetical protein n=1 Tax=unclassified Xanthomonas TaxID=2643310 RepID=UPI002A810B6E|nr:MULTISPECIES: hypothetical protein [unclassified Xanthomonas]MDY4297523.1 hypothetical protein [Xanthomonas sp. LF02-5]MDY4359317.1 hypothetical protein [Xanthomonas sp. LF04-12]
MTHPLTRSNAAQRAAALIEETQFRQLQDDIRAVFDLPAGRRLVWAFVQAMGVDASPFNTNAMAQARAIGRQEAAQWWLHAIRDNCPEREPQMRTEANKAQKQLQQQLNAAEESDHDD